MVPTRRSRGETTLRIIKNILQAVVLTVLLALCAGLLYILIIMGDGPKTDLVLEATPSPPPLASMPQDSLRFEATDLYQAEYYFNEPFARLPENMGWTLDGIVVSNYVPQGQQNEVREICLRYVDDRTGGQVNVSTITPSISLRALPGRGFVAATNQDLMICGLRAVLMRKDMTLHLHAQRDEVVYQVEGDIDLETLQRVAPLLEI